MRDTPKPSIHPAGGSPGDAAAAEAEAKQIPNYAGLSADHPGYDNGEGVGIGDPAPGPSLASAGAEIHVIPDEDVRPATPHPAASVWPVKQDTPA